MVALGDEEQSLVAPLNIRFRRKNAAVQSEERSKPKFLWEDSRDAAEANLRNRRVWLRDVL